MRDLVRPAEARDLPGLVDALAEAFEGSPLTEWIVRRDASWARRARLYFDMLASLAMPHGCVLTEATQLGGALWIPPGAARVGLAQRIALLPRFARITGLREFPSRFLGLSQIADHHPSEPHYYLEAIGVRPEARRQGIASLLLQPMLERCDADAIGAYLHTSDAGNLPFYARHGFSERARFRIGRKSEGPLIYALWRSAGQGSHPRSGPD